jgi:propanol-preferring alcohol dehydrogenase
MSPSVGHLAVQIAARGLGLRVIGIDHGSKKDLATECGAEVFIDHTKGNVEEEVKKATAGLGAQSVLVLTAANGAYASYVSSFIHSERLSQGLSTNKCHV